MENQTGQKHNVFLLNAVNNRNLIFIALGLRFIMGLGNFIPDDKNIYIYLFLYEALTYILICSLVVLNSDNLSQYFLDRPALILFMLGGTLLRTTIIEIPICLEMIPFWGATIWLFFYLKKRQIPLNKPMPNWWLWGMLIGVLWGLSILIININRASITGNFNALLIPILVDMMHQTSHSSIMEEPLFRGFLWGYLNSRGWKNLHIWIFQAFLFWLVHISYISRPFTFWIAAPLAGLLLGALAWKTKSFAAPILAHTIFNVIIQVIK